MGYHSVSACTSGTGRECITMSCTCRHGNGYHGNESVSVWWDRLNDECFTWREKSFSYWVLSAVKAMWCIIMLFSHETAINLRIRFKVIYNLFAPEAPNMGVSILVMKGSLQKMFEEKCSYELMPPTKFLDILAFIDSFSCYFAWNCNNVQSRPTRLCNV